MNSKQYVKGYKAGYKDGIRNKQYAEIQLDKDKRFLQGYEEGFEDGIYMERPDKELDKGQYLYYMLITARAYRKPPIV